MSACNQPERPGDEFNGAFVLLDDLDGIVEVASIPGLTLRQLTSRQQVERFANVLRNCAGGMVGLVRSGQSRLFGLEMRGTPVELLEVDVETGRIGRWLAFRNSPPNPHWAEPVTLLLFEMRLAVPG